VSEKNISPSVLKYAELNSKVSELESQDTAFLIS
jgi:hypothetical protein